uniref:Enhancer of yellow 2 transcription factor n=1 Tax=Corethrella appendiculata TaxID=1370023 RepID=U5EXI7_9DIPT
MTFTKSVDQITILYGDRSKLKDLLRLRLTECGWSDQVRLLCRETIKEQGTLNCEQIVQNVTPKARSLVPDTVKKELLQKIKTILIKQEGIDL